MWKSYPDGRDPRAPHGNYPYPWEAGGATHDGRTDRPWVETGVRAIPGVSGKYVAVAANHHANDGGSLISIDINIPDDNKMSQVRRFEPTKFKDESCGDDGGITDNFLTGNVDWFDPWPLCGGYLMAGQNSNEWLVDKFGNKEWIFSIPGELNTMPIRFARPLSPRTKPPTLATMTYQGARSGSSEHKAATLGVINIYKSDIPFPPGTKIRQLRVIQLIARPWEYPFNEFPGRVNGRMVLGTVPVDDDGSAYFLAPVGKSLYFQALDERGCAVQSMRSATFVHAGEQLQCIGCHENKWEATPPARPTAFMRPPSPLTPNLEDGSCPISWARLVKPILDSRGAGLTVPEWRLDGGTNGCAGVGGEGYRSIPGKVGARAVGLDKILFNEPWRSKLTQEDIRRLILWVDVLSMKYTANFDYSGQDQGKVVWPNHEVDPANPAGTEDKYGFPIPGGVTVGRSKQPKMGTGRISSSVRNGTITIINNTQREELAEIFDSRGRSVRALRVPPGSTVSADVTDRLLPGMYVLRFRGSASNHPKQIVVTRQF